MNEAQWQIVSAHIARIHECGQAVFTIWADDSVPNGTILLSPLGVWMNTQACRDMQAFQERAMYAQ